MKRDWIRITLTGIFVSLLTACNQVGTPSLPNETQTQAKTNQSIDDKLTQEPQMNDTQMTQSSLSSNLESQIEKAKEDLARRLSIAITEINLAEARQVTWPDASLGCPQRGVLYIQVLTDGFLILFEANGIIYEYHTDTGEQVILCQILESPIFPVKPGEIDDGQPWMPN